MLLLQKKRNLDNLIEMYGKKNKHVVKGKTKKIAWFVTNCNAPSGRGKYVKKLQQYIPVSYIGTISSDFRVF